jgi:hypothetical protein
MYTCALSQISPGTLMIIKKGGGRLPTPDPAPSSLFAPASRAQRSARIRGTGRDASLPGLYVGSLSA